MEVPASTLFRCRNREASKSRELFDVLYHSTFFGPGVHLRARICVLVCWNLDVLSDSMCIESVHDYSFKNCLLIIGAYAVRSH